MAPKTFFVRAEWDDEAGVWYVAESDVPGLAAEAETVEALHDKLRVLVPELMKLNRHLIDWPGEGEGADLPISIMAQKVEHFRLTS